MYRAISLDVYGTVVHEDDDVLTPICEQVAGLAGVDGSVVAELWWRLFCEANQLSHGEGFRRQGELNRDTLAATMLQFDVHLDAARLCEPQVAYWRQPPIYPDSLPFLHQVGLPVCLVSNIDRDDLEAAIDHHGLVVSAVVTSEDARAYKPRAEPFELALKTLGLPASEVLHVGDSLTADVAGAEALGLDTAWINRSGRRLPQGCAATFTATSLAELLVVLRL